LSTNIKGMLTFPKLYREKQAEGLNIVQACRGFEYQQISGS